MRRLFTLGLASMLTASVVLAGETLPSDAQRVLEALDQEAAAIRQEAEQRILAHRRKAIAALRELQDRYTREALLDEAVAIRDRIRALAEAPALSDLMVMPAPERLYDFRSLLGQSFLFQVMGRPEGSVWGTDVYTGDSHLPAAAVHAGAVELGETRVVKVTILPGQPAYNGSARHNVSSNGYGGYAFSYKVERTNIAVRPQLTQPVTPPVPGFPGGFPGRGFPGSGSIPGAPFPQ